MKESVQAPRLMNTFFGVFAYKYLNNADLIFDVVLGRSAMAELIPKYLSARKRSF